MYTEGEATVLSSTFQGCRADQEGGALAVFRNDGRGTIINTTFSNNNAGQYAGALYVDMGGSAALVGGMNAFSGNRAGKKDGWGHSVFKNGAYLSTESSLAFDLCPPGTFQPRSIPNDEKYAIEDAFVGCPLACPAGKTTASFPAYAARKGGDQAAWCAEECPAGEDRGLEGRMAEIARRRGSINQEAAR